VYFALSAILIDLRASAFDDSSIIYNVAIEKYSFGPVSGLSPLQRPQAARHKLGVCPIMPADEDAIRFPSEVTQA
jgi:hypothetical protein